MNPFENSSIDDSRLDTFRQFFTLSLDLLCTVNDRLYFQELNPAWELVLGWTLAELRSQPLTNLIHPEDLQKTIAEARRLLNDSSTTVNFENRYRHKNGSWVVLSWVVIVRNGIFFASARDITAYKKAQAALEASELRLKAITDTLVGAIILFDQKGIIEYFNPAAHHIFGHTCEHAIGKNIGFLIPKMDFSAIDRRPHRYGELDRSKEVEGIHADGSPLYLDVMVGTIDVDDQQMFIISVQNITRMKNVENFLQQFKTTLDKTNDGVFIFENKTLRFIYANRGAVNQLGYSLEELLQMTPLDLKPAFDEPTYRQLLESLIKDKLGTITFETFHRHKDGHEIPVEILLQYVTYPGESPRFINIARDLTERRRVEKMKTEFISTVSHELRTPLTCIQGALGLISSGTMGDVPVMMQEYIKVALSNSERLSRLVNDILDLERIQSDSIELRYQVFDLGMIVDEAVRIHEPLAVSHGVTLVWERMETIIDVIVDKDRLIQVLTNFISNAIKFSPMGESVEVTMMVQSTMVRVNIRDHGPGVPEEFQPRLFERFAQADSSDARKKEGSGLGLSISKALIERMKGAVGFHSLKGGGALFYLDLPLHRQESPATDERLTS